jgi:hypothetical protein
MVLQGFESLLIENTNCSQCFLSTDLVEIKKKQLFTQFLVIFDLNIPVFHKVLGPQTW